MDKSTEEVSAAPPMPEETAADEKAQPEEEDEAEILNAGIRQGILEQVGDMVNFLERGRFPLGDREHTFRGLRELEASLARLPYRLEAYLDESATHVVGNSALSQFSSDHHQSSG